MNEVLIKGEGLNTQGRNAWIRKGEGSSATAIPLGDVPGGDEASMTIDRVQREYSLKH